MGVVSSLNGLILTRIGDRHLRSAVLSRQQPRARHLVSAAASARAPTPIYSVGQYVGLGFLSVPLFWITQRFGWRGLFLHRRRPRHRVRVHLVGALSQPEPSSRDREPGRARLHRGGRRRRIQGAAAPVQMGATSARCCKHRQIVGASIGQFGGNSTQVFFVTWFPTYLVTARGMTFIQAGFMTSLPYIGGVGRRARGRRQSRTRILKRTGSANLARKLPIVGGMLLASTIVLANYVPAGSNTAGHRHHVGRVLRPGHDQPGLDGDLRRRTQEADRADQRHLQLQRQPRRHHHAAGHRHRVPAHRARSSVH